MTPGQAKVIIGVLLVTVILSLTVSVVAVMSFFSVKSDLHEIVFSIQNDPRFVIVEKGMRKLHSDFNYLKARDSLKNGKVNEAKQLLLESIRNNPKSPNHYYQLGKIHFLEKNFDEAIQHCLNEKENNPHSEQNLNLLGVLYFTKGNLNSALEHFKTLHTLYPNNWDAINNISEIYREQGLAQNALDVIEEYLKSSQQDKYMQFKRRVTLLEIGNAKEAIQDLIVKDIETLEGADLLVLGVSAFKQGQVDSALELLSQARSKLDSQMYISLLKDNAFKPYLRHIFQNQDSEQS